MIGKVDGQLVSGRIMEMEAYLEIMNQAEQPLLQILHVIIYTLQTKESVHQTLVSCVILAQISSVELDWLRSTIAQRLALSNH